MVWRADEEVAVAVEIGIAERADRRAELVAGGRAVERAQESEGRPRVHAHPPRVRAPRGVEGGADRVIEDSVMVDIAHHRDRRAELVARRVAVMLVDLVSRLAVVDEDAPRIGAVAVLFGSSDGELLETVEVEIPKIHDDGAEVRAGLRPGTRVIDRGRIWPREDVDRPRIVAIRRIVGIADDELVVEAPRDEEVGRGERRAERAAGAARAAGVGLEGRLGGGAARENEGDEGCGDRGGAHGRSRWDTPNCRARAAPLHGNSNQAHPRPSAPPDAPPITAGCRGRVRSSWTD